ncbi:MAG: hypothetical protein ACE5G1_01155 [bacterium]
MQLKIKKMCVYLLWAGLIVISSRMPGFAQTKSQVTITSGANQISRTEVGKALSAVLYEANKIAEGTGDLTAIKDYFSPSGFAVFAELVNKTGLFTTIVEYRTHLLQTASGQYEVRGIKVRVQMGETTGDDIQELVFVLNFRLFITNVQFAMETHHYTRLIEEGRRLEDMIYRQQILDFLENFRTAHNRKDIAYLESAYSDDALIIVGRVLEKQEGSSDFLESSTLSEHKIEFIKLSKRQYIDRLREVFKLNSFVRVIFDGVEIVRHSKFKEIYGIKLRQRWHSSTYSDEGYLFVMIDFNDPTKPLIHVRAWQPEPFEDGSVVGLGDFEIIE